MNSFKEAMKALLTSKKFLTTIAGVIIVLSAKIGWQIDDEVIWQVVVLIGACVTGQGMADMGKYKTTP